MSYKNDILTIYLIISYLKYHLHNFINNRIENILFIILKRYKGGGKLQLISFCLIVRYSII